MKEEAQTVNFADEILAVVGKDAGRKRGCAQAEPAAPDAESILAVGRGKKFGGAWNR